jgi:hypothetical protein
LVGLLFYAVLDELWRVLRSGAGMVERVDELTRLNRGHAVGTAYITHSLADLEALPTEADRAKARGFVERAAVVVCPMDRTRTSHLSQLELALTA